MSAILRYGDTRLLNVPAAKDVADEVLLRDCYRIGTIPEGLRVLDAGAFYGEFAIACAHRGFAVEAYEPNHESFDILSFNTRMNGAYEIIQVCAALSSADGLREFTMNDAHPAGSKLSEGSAGYVPVFNINDIVSINRRLDRWAVKLDVEGEESAMFDSPAWLERVDWLAMEWHNCDGDRYADILRGAGFDVEMSCAGENSGGIIHARRKA